MANDNNNNNEFIQPAHDSDPDANKTLLLITASCSSCVRARKFFVDNQLPFVEENFYSQPISEKHFKDILSMTENGVYDIISQRSKFLSSNKIDIDELKISELIELIHQHPSIVKRPILLQYDKSGLPKRLMIGYNSQDIKVFCRPIKDIEVHHSITVSDDGIYEGPNNEVYGNPVEGTTDIAPAMITEKEQSED
ncbi:Spx/MgsR family RNA polymerase-binding regulatory protein [[Mycoplasma] testudinis]|uniref:Spx/MgsR family RNA polymerase-binding regulatory protein n=1 Tax=[Mycoplasma] testudinis TaxID=33924 RepID=UPI000A03A34D|nr:Spx/MgsR family RNA polymerase-binding regulatory protein [[Mycoplasma] testudinis]